MIFKFLKNKSGFTLIEILVSISILLLISGAAISIFVSVVMGQRAILAGQEISSQMSYTLEYISKALRMAGRDFTGSCIIGANGESGLNYLLTKYDPGKGIYKGIKFINQSDNNACQEFFLDDSNPSKTIIKGVKNGGQPVSLTSDKINISSFKFIINGDAKPGAIDHSSDSDMIQPRITISLAASFWGSNNLPARIQTTISQKNLNIK